MMITIFCVKCALITLTRLWIYNSNLFTDRKSINPSSFSFPESSRSSKIGVRQFDSVFFDSFNFCDDVMIKIRLIKLLFENFEPNIENAHIFSECAILKSFENQENDSGMGKTQYKRVSSK